METAVEQDSMGHYQSAVSLLFSLSLTLALAFFLPASAQSSQSRKFLALVKSRLIEENHLKAQRGESLDARVQKLCPYETKAAARMILFQYGAAFTASDRVRVPDRCVFLDEGDVQRFQATAKIKSAMLGDTLIELQESAMEALEVARSEAQSQGLDITPLDGSIAARRVYRDTVAIWNSRFDPAIRYWIGAGRIAPTELDAVNSLDIFSLIEKVSAWEKQGLFFGTGTYSSIFSSVAPPGTSQHLSMIALDVVQHGDPRVRLIMAKNGWFQTIKGDMTHFTYLGVLEQELPGRGLQFVIYNDRGFWIPAAEIDPATPLAPSESIPLTIGDRTVRALIYKGKPLKILLFNMHDDENTAVDAARSFVKINGGTMVELTHTGERLITFDLYDRTYKVDPNRIFTLDGISKTLVQYGGTSPEAEAEVARFAQELVARFVNGRPAVVALHNNGNNAYSSASYNKGGEYAKDAAEVYLDPKRDADDFFYVTERKHFDGLKAKGYNVVLQNNDAVTDDGSLSVYCGRQKITYINVEAEHGHKIEQERMLTDLLDLLGK